MEIKKSIKFFSIDIDGCLNSGKNEALNLKKLDEIREFFFSKRYSFTLCTGRGIEYAQAYSQIMGCNNPIVCENGGVIYYPSTNDFKLNLSINKWDFKKLEKLSNMIDKTLTEKYTGYKKEIGKITMLSLNPPTNIEISDFFEYISSFIGKRFPDFYVTRSQSAVDISPRGIDKNEGLKIVLRELSIDYENVCAIGDSIGDIPVLKKVAFPACPDNADESVKNICKYVASKKFEEGVLEILSLF